MYETKFKFSNIFTLVLIAGGLINSADAIECYVCTSNILESCSSLKEELPVELCTTDVTSCYTKTQNGVTMRGCFPPKNSIHPFECIKSEGYSACVLCDLNKCNDKNFSSVDRQHCDESGCDYHKNKIGDSFNLKNYVELITCIICDSEMDAKCRDRAEAFEEKLCEFMEGCYLSVEGDHVKRGCVSDLGGEQKNSCVFQSNLCKTCFGKICNEKTAFQICYSCNTNLSSECVQKNSYNTTAIETVICKGYLDWCVVGIDADGQTYRKCSNSNEINDAELPNVYGCYISKCNWIDFPFDRRLCFQCDDCDLLSSSELKPEFCSTYKKNDQCYTYISQERKVYRGCMSDLSNNNPSLCASNSLRCEICSQNTCNNKPKSTQKDVCVKCDSKKDMWCRADPKADGKGNECDSIDLLNESGCYLSVEGEKVKRGCISDLDEDAEQLVKCTSQSDSCKTCSGENCNEKLTFQTCYSCDTSSASECVQNISIIETTVCKDYLNVCVTGVDDNGQTHRGCSKGKADNDVEFPNGYKECSRNKCNSDDFPKDRRYCFQCDDCDMMTSNAVELYSKICSTYKKDDQCYTYFSDDEKVYRGCMSDTNNNQLLCENDNTKCIQCSTNACNTQTTTHDLCVKCDSATDSKCRDQPIYFIDSICKSAPLSNEKGCYLSIEDDLVKRGCISDFDEETEMKQKVDCISQSNMCKTCVGKNCNQKDTFQNCYSCKSSSSAECTEIGASTDIVVCKDYMNKCIIGIDEMGRTHRRCSMGNAIDDHELEDYVECSEDKCNGYIFPKDQLQCYQCENCETTENVLPKACNRYWKEDDDCYTHIVGGNIYRGCISDPIKNTSNVPTCNKDPKNCVKCHQNRCNNQPKFTLPTVSCVSCHNSNSCAFSQNPEDSVVCKNQVFFPMKESCFTRSIGATDVKRGCTVDGDEDDIKSCANIYQNCTRCIGSKCNINNMHYSSCLQCNSQKEKSNDCIKVEEKHIETLSKLCYGEYPYSQRGCFTKEMNGTVTRGCWKDLTDVEFDACVKDDQCKFCTENNCNKQSASASAKIFPHYVLIFSIIFAILH